ncbi:MAG: 3,4-dihydroxy-2-butanone-4-phosphate synthase [Candidatus Micrarchaeota archaeon]
MGVEEALGGLKKGRMAVLYDSEGREGEADLVFSARFASPEKVEALRKDAGGLLCAAIGGKDAEEIGLPFFTDVLEGAGNGLQRMSCVRTGYGDRPAFSLPVNHRDVYTGITDNDRALTLKRLDEVVRGRKEDFAEEFCSPGHVFLLIGRGLENRRGHTELALELAERAGLGGAVALCEMLGKGRALPKKDAIAYARRHNLAFVEGKELV